MKNIYLEPVWKQPVSAETLLKYPPQGYRFTTRLTSMDRGIRLAARTGFTYIGQRQLNKVMPIWLMKSFLGRFNPPPRDTSLTYAIIHLVFRREPWVLDMQCEPPFLLVGHERHFNGYRNMVRRILTSDYCRKIIYPIEAGKKALISALDCEELAPKTEVVPWTVPAKHFVKNSNGHKTRLLFVNSGNINEPLHFDKKGGKELLEAFLELNRRYDNLELVIRSMVSPEIREKCRHIENIRLIDSPIPWEELEHEWQTADIFVLPTHVTPFLVFLDAMSYELPIITTGVWANGEIVNDGKTGFLIPPSEVAEYVDDRGVYMHSREFNTVVRTLAPGMVAALVEKLGVLIENSELRRQMGKAARWEVEHGRFSVKTRNEKLKRIFDEATNGTC